MASYGKLIDKDVIRQKLREWHEELAEAETEFNYFMNSCKPYNIPPVKFLGFTWDSFPQFVDYADFQARHKEELEKDRSTGSWIRMYNRFDKINIYEPRNFWQDRIRKLKDIEYFLTDSIVEVYMSDEDWSDLNRGINLHKYVKTLGKVFLFTK